MTNTVTRDDGYSWVQPRVSKEKFVQVLTDANSPVVSERNVDEYYDMCIPRIDPLFVLAMFAKESSFGTQGMATITHSWGNMRNEPVGDVPHSFVSGGVLNREGHYVGFNNWGDGLVGTINHLDDSDYKGLTIGDAIAKWAPRGDGGNDPDAYSQFVVDKMNEWGDMIPERIQPAPDGVQDRNIYVIVQAGHENISSITDDHLGSGWGDKLRGGTGAQGEMQSNVDTAHHLQTILASAGITVGYTDATYNADVWNRDASIAIALHQDGVSFGNDRPQHAGCVTVHSGPSTVDADSRADAFCQAYKTFAPEITGITDENVDTVDMEQYYGGNYRTADTPMAIVETCISAGSDGIRPDKLDSLVAARAVAVAVFDYLGMESERDSVRRNVDGSTGVDAGSQQSQPGNPHDPSDKFSGKQYRYFTTESGRSAVQFRAAGQHTISGGFFQFYNGTEGDTINPGDFHESVDKETGINYKYGLPLTDEFTMVMPGTRQPMTVQYTERARLEYHVDDPNTGKGHVELGRIGYEQLATLDAHNRPSNAWLQG